MAHDGRLEKCFRSRAILSGFFVHLSFVISSVCLTVVLLEIGIRIINPQDLGYWDSRSFRRLLVTKPHFVENIPNGKATFLGVPVTINSVGLRDVEVTPKPPHTVRIVAVGDSITFGYGMRIEETYAKVLEKLLNEDSTNGIRYEVLNGGTLGGSLSDYLHFLELKAAALEPDIVMVGLCLNDVQVYSESGSVTNDEDETAGRRLRLRRLNYFLLRHSQLYMLVYSGLKAALYMSGILDLNKSQGENYLALQPPSDHQAEAWNSSLGLLQRISEFCAGHHYKLVVVIFPMQMQMSPADLQFYRNRYHLRIGDGALAGDPQQKLHNFALSAGLVIVDLLPVFRGYDSIELYLKNKKIPHDPTHPSVKGNQIAANAIFRALESTRQIDESGADRPK